MKFSLKHGRRFSAVAIVFALVGSDAGAEAIEAAMYTSPVDRYGHFALGRPHEYARLTVTTDSGRTLVFELPEDEVFEDLTPRRVKLSDGETEEILTVVSGRDVGSRLAMFALRGDRLAISAQSAPIGTPMRWLNPVGVTDLDGDGHAEIAAVITPHIGGMLKVFRRQGSKLVEISALRGFSNHVIGSTALALAAPVSIAGRNRLLVPDTTRSHLRVVGLENGRLLEIGRCALSAPVTGAIKVLSPWHISIDLLIRPE